MKKGLFVILSLLSISAGLCAQNPSFPENQYRSKSNQYYWGNRPPYAGYWQQDVHYKIDASLNDKAGVITATEELTYWNNSPDTLYFVFFHLYQNAFQPGSYMSMLFEVNKDKPRYGQYEAAGMGTTVDKIESNGTALKTELDNTILKVYLEKPLAPGASLKLDIAFKTFYDVGSMRRRMKAFGHSGYKHFDAVHWYPRMAVYDLKHGWNTAQHLGREFYGDYGTFDITLTLPAEYVLDGTGVLLNENEVLPAELMQKLDIKNFADKPFNSPPSVIIERKEATKTWRFHAENVHDFAWTADPTYRIGKAEWNGVKVIALAQEEHASKWQNAADYTAKIIKTFSEDFGMYAWPKIIVADARDGMEYPMLTLDGGQDPDYRSLLTHEVGHMWFFGMLGNNETYRAFLDEGFTQFLTVWGMNRIDGAYEVRNEPKNKWLRHFRTHQPVREERLIQRYLETADDEEMPPINTHSDEFGTSIRHGGGYSQVYYKTGVMLYNLQYVLGDSLFQGAMRHYFNKWKIAHPYPEDFTQAITEYVGMDLSWFFDQWMNTQKYADYAIKGVKRGTTPGEKIITFERKGTMQMPLDFTVYTKDGKAHNYYIPNTWLEKETDATRLDRWIGWNELNTTYEAKINIEGKIKDIIIDTSGRLADVDLMNNRLKCPIKLNFDAGVYNVPDRHYYELKWRPDVWYNSVDGIKAGLHLEGDYFNKKNFLSLTAWYNSGQSKNESYASPEGIRGLLSFNANYHTPVKKLDNSLQWDLSMKMLDGLVAGQSGFTKELKNNSSIRVGYKSMIRPTTEDINYLLYPQFWIANQWNNRLDLTYRHLYGGFKSRGELTLGARTSAFSDYHYTMVDAELKHHITLSRLIFSNRLYAAYSGGQSVAPESKIFLAQGNPEQMMDNKFARSRGFVPSSWLGLGPQTNHFQYAGGLNLRGFAGYLLPVDSFFILGVNGSAGAAYNAELDYSRLFRFKPKGISNYLQLSTYLFFDAGIINLNAIDDKLEPSALRMDAGPGFALTIKKWAMLETAKPLTIRFDMPLFLNPAPFLDGGNFKFRWVVGINRVF